jgi:hypothetical protein
MSNGHVLVKGRLRQQNHAQLGWIQPAGKSRNNVLLLVELHQNKLADWNSLCKCKLFVLDMLLRFCSTWCTANYDWTIIGLSK